MHLRPNSLIAVAFISYTYMPQASIGHYMAWTVCSCRGLFAVPRPGSLTAADSEAADSEQSQVQKQVLM